MERTKIGLTVPVTGALAFVVFLFGGYVAGLLFTGYILLCEENVQLRKNALLAIFAAVTVSLVGAVINFLPDVVNVFESFLNLLTLNVHVPFVDSFANFLYYILNVVKPILFVGLAVLAWQNKPVKLAILDKLI